MISVPKDAALCYVLGIFVFFFIGSYCRFLVGPVFSGRI